VISLHALSVAWGLPKTTLYDRAKKLGIDTSSGISEEDQEKLRQEFSKPVKSEAALVAKGYSLPEVPEIEVLPDISFIRDQQVIAQSQAAAQKAVNSCADLVARYAEYRAAQAIQNINTAYAQIEAIALSRSLNSVAAEIKKED